MDSIRSLVEQLTALSTEDRSILLGGLSEGTARALRYDWEIWARGNQLPPKTDWRTWLILSGRGWGKTRTGAEWVRAEIESGRRKRVAMIGATVADYRDTMVGCLMEICPPWATPRYEPSRRRVMWPNGAVAMLYSAEEPDRLRGPQHDGAWCDELAAWRYPDTWDQLMLGLRLGADPRTVVTTTPRPIPIVKRILEDKTTHFTKGSTYDNAANLPAHFLDTILSKYKGTRLGEQEIYAEILDDVPGALWRRADIEVDRIRQRPVELDRIVVAIDPAVTADKDSDETGIVVAGIGQCSCQGSPDMHGFVLDDLSGRFTPNDWGQRAVGAYRRHEADRIVAEVNNGGQLVEVNLRTVDASIPYTAVRASQGKRTRAEPIAALYEQHKIHHVGMLAQLEDQMTSWDPLAGDKSPDRVDALVWALSELMLRQIPELLPQWRVGRRRI